MTSPPFGTTPLTRTMVGCVVIAVITGTWEVLARTGLIANVLLPAPSVVIAGLFHAFERGELVRDILASLQRVMIGYAIGATCGIGCGLLYLWRWPRLIISVLAESARPIPPPAWIPLALLWCGYGNPAAYFLVALGSFFPVVTATHLGLSRTELGFARTAQVLGLTRWQIFRNVTLPQALPSILAGLRVGLGVAWMILVTAELVGAQSGLGYMVQISRAQLQTDLVVGAMLVIGLMGFLLTQLVVHLERFILPWRSRGRELGLE